MYCSGGCSTRETQGSGFGPKGSGLRLGVSQRPSSATETLVCVSLSCSLEGRSGRGCCWVGSLKTRVRVGGARYAKGGRM